MVKTEEKVAEIELGQLVVEQGRDSRELPKTFDLSMGQGNVEVIFELGPIIAGIERTGTWQITVKVELPGDQPHKEEPFAFVIRKRLA
jgi:hypothetical protein